jgi:hypothetical protein
MTSPLFKMSTCNNTLYIRGPSEEISRFCLRVTIDDGDLDLELIVPKTDDYHQTWGTAAVDVDSFTYRSSTEILIGMVSEQTPPLNFCVNASAAFPQLVFVMTYTIQTPGQ